MVAVAAAVAISIVDTEADLHLADRMAAVRVDPNENIAERIFDRVVIEIGKQAVEFEKS
jgi:hypothetical protein